MESAFTGRYCTFGATCATMGDMSAQVDDFWIPRATTFAARLALIRWRMGWNMKEAALACGIPQGSWRDWELRGREPRKIVDIANRIAERIGVDPVWILTGRDNGGEPDGPHHPDETGDEGRKSLLPESNWRPSHYKDDSSVDQLRVIPLFGRRGHDVLAGAA